MLFGTGHADAEVVFGNGSTSLSASVTAGAGLRRRARMCVRRRSMMYGDWGSGGNVGFEEKEEDGWELGRGVGGMEKVAGNGEGSGVGREGEGAVGSVFVSVSVVVGSFGMREDSYAMVTRMNCSPRINTSRRSRCVFDGTFAVPLNINKIPKNTSAHTHPARQSP